MGEYWKWVCPERAEQLRSFAGESNKNPERAQQASFVLALLLTRGSWRGCAVRLASDEGTSGCGYYDLSSEDGWPEPPDLFTMMALAKGSA